jgi:DNA-binding transcriptional regulator YiaG
MPKEVRSPEQQERDRRNERRRRAERRAAALLPLPSTQERVRLRVAAGLNKTEFAKQMGLSYYAVKEWENGRDPRSIRLHNLYATALEGLRTTSSPVVDRALTQFEHTWEALTAAHNGYGWTDDQVVRLRRLVKNVQMSVYKATKGGTDDGTEV